MKNNYSDLGKNEFNKNNLDLALLYYKFDVYYNNDLKYLAYYNIGVIYFLKKEYSINRTVKLIDNNAIKVSPTHSKIDRGEEVITRLSASAIRVL